MIIISIIITITSDHDCTVGAWKRRQGGGKRSHKRGNTRAGEAQVNHDHDHEDEDEDDYEDEDDHEDDDEDEDEEGAKKCFKLAINLVI